MKTKVFLAVTIMIFAATVSAQENVKSVWNFDQDAQGAPAKGFTTVQGEWKVVADEGAPSLPNVLAQTAKNPGFTFNVALVESATYKDVELCVKMKAIAGREDQGGGLIWRAKDARNYYVARYNPLEDNYNLYKVVGGRRSELKGARVKGDKEWHVLTVSMRRDYIECFLDGKKYLAANDSTFADAGKIGLWSKSDAQSHFDDLTVSGK